jgi:hypothetical protein
VRKVHSVPPFGHAPSAWLKAAKQVVETRHIDLLFARRSAAGPRRSRELTRPCSFELTH